VPYSDPVLEIQDLVVARRHARVLDGLSLRVERGQVFGFIGPNGAGKTTAIQAVLGLLPAASGRILLHGLSPSDPRSRREVGFLPEETTYYRFLTPVEILHFYGRLFGLRGAELRRRTDRLIELVGLGDAARRRIGSLSKGTAQKVGLAQALVNDPRTLILDEPTSGLDPVARLELRRILADLKHEGRTVFFSSHELSEVELLCDAVVVLKKGRAVRSGALRDVLGSRGDRSLERYFLDLMREAA
jgi:ABC-2 type transport system ATP-binding protein